MTKINEKKPIMMLGPKHENLTLFCWHDWSHNIIIYRSLSITYSMDLWNFNFSLSYNLVKLKGLAIFWLDERPIDLKKYFW